MAFQPVPTNTKSHGKRQKSAEGLAKKDHLKRNKVAETKNHSDLEKSKPWQYNAIYIYAVADCAP